MSAHSPGSHRTPCMTDEQKLAKLKDFESALLLTLAMLGGPLIILIGSLIGFLLKAIIQ